MDQEKLILKKIEEQFNRFEKNYAFEASDFLTLEEQSQVAGFVRLHAKDGAMFYGGYADADRKQVIFVPDYMGIKSEEEAISYFSQNEEESELSILDLRIPKGEPRKLGHRNYLGAFMAEGLKREIIGDILVSDSGAQIIVKKEMANVLSESFTKAGRVTLIGEILPLSGLNLGIIRTENLRCNVPSVRLDNVVSEVFSVSRKDATTAINRGMVFVNGVEMTKPDYQLKGEEAHPLGDKIVLRGKGKAIYKKIVGTSKKGNLYIEIIKYI